MSSTRNKSAFDWEAILGRAAKAGKEAILSQYDSKARTEVVGRGFGGDLTLRIDEASEKAIHESLNNSLGEDSYLFVSEELGEVPIKDKDVSRPIIICDPLDGSHNAEVGIPLFSISLSVLGIIRKMKKSDKRRFGDIDFGYILSVPTSDYFYAEKGRGAFHNSNKIPSRKSHESSAKIRTLLIECSDADYLRTITQRLSNEYVNKTRLLGSAAISYCLLADGSAEAFIFAQPGGARTIDSPAGYLIAREAGCVFEDFLGKEKSIDDVEVGFHSRISVLGASDEKTMELLKSKVRLP